MCGILGYEKEERKMEKVIRNSKGIFVKGHGFTPEMLEKMRTIKLGKSTTENQRIALANGRKIREKGGYKLSEEAKKGISERSKVNIKKFHPSTLYLKGKTYEEIYGSLAEEQKRRRVESRKKTFYEKWILKGKPERRPHHSGAEYVKWRTEVFKRDDYRCLDCGAKNGGEEFGRVTLNADHIYSFASFPRLRLMPENGRTLCLGCHRKTSTYGKSVSYTKRHISIYS